MRRYTLRQNAALGLPLFTLLALSACGGDSSSTYQKTPSSQTESKSIEGSGVKGPLAFASVKAYTFNSSSIDFKGTLIDTGETDSQAAITGLTIPSSYEGAVVLEIVANPDTVDLTTGTAPIITQLLTVADSSNIENTPIYPSPLTTIAFRLAGENGNSTEEPYNGDGNDILSPEEFLSAFQVAARQTASALGFGMDPDTDINTTPPLITDSTDTEGELAATLAYRTAIEAISAVISNMQDEALANNSDTTVSENQLLTAISQDLSDGTIDGQNDSTSIDAFADISDVSAQITTDPSTLVVPGTSIPLTDIETLLVDEVEDTGSTADTTALEDGSVSSDPEPAATEPDSDGDNTPDSSDNCPSIPNSPQSDSDNDGHGDSCDAFPEDSNEWNDFDGDGIGDNADSDDDNDGVNDENDYYPFDPTRTADDTDGDGVSDREDAFPTDPAESTDTDGDGIGDNADTDDDGDGFPDDSDAFPKDKSENTDTDGDGIGNNADPDDDNDGTNDADDAFPLDKTEDTDTDQDGIGNNADPDDDGDGVSDDNDQYPLDSSEQFDTDDDGVGNNADTDDDNDGVNDADDDFPLDAAEHTDTDGDGIGDNADTDDDNDGVNDEDDDFPLDATEHTDTDGDGVGDNADTDDDNDGVSDSNDAFPKDSSESADTDGDGIGNNADPDDDNDGVDDESDNCPLTSNPLQIDLNLNGTGDDCEEGAIWDESNWDSASWQ